jgi:hypothetical protein
MGGMTPRGPLLPVPVTTTPAHSLDELERIVNKGLGTFIEVGLALVEIRDRRLYREAGYTAFERYCRERWGWSRQHAYRLIDGAQVAALVSPIGDTPANESQARELAPLAHFDQERAVALWSELRAHHGPDLTARTIRRIVQRYLADGGDGVADFVPVGADDQRRLDRGPPVTCLRCGDVFTSNATTAARCRQCGCSVRVGSAGSRARSSAVASRRTNDASASGTDIGLVLVAGAVWLAYHGARLPAERTSERWKWIAGGIVLAAVGVVVMRANLEA